MVYYGGMIIRMIGLLLTFLFIIACGKLEYSPYAVDVDNKNLNERNLSRIFTSTRMFQKPVNVDYKFLVISDTHDYYDGLQRQINYINSNASKYDFLIITGDMSNVGLVSEFEETLKYLSKLKIPFLTTSGNHDLLIDGEAIYQRLFGDDTYSFIYRNTKFIIYNNNNWESSGVVPDYDWLDSELRTNNEENLIVLSHVPPNDKKRFSSTEIELMKNMMRENSVDYYINGHNHNPTGSIFGGATQVTVGASSKNVMLEVSVNSDGVSHAYINL